MEAIRGLLVTEMRRPLLRDHQYRYLFDSCISGSIPVNRYEMPSVGTLEHPGNPIELSGMGIGADCQSVNLGDLVLNLTNTA